MSVTLNGSRLKQTTTVTARQFFGQASPRTITAQAALSEQYTPFVGLYQSFSQIYTVYPGTADELVRRYGWDIYDYMMSDAMVAGCVNDIVNGVINDDVDVVPANTSEAGLYMAQWVRRNLRAMQVASTFSPFEVFRQLLKQSLVYGHAVGEMVFDEVNMSGRRVFLLRKLVPILPTRYFFRMSAEGDVIGVVPFRYDTSTALAVTPISRSEVVDTAVVPLAKLFYSVWNRRGLFPDGQSVLFPAHKAWALKQEIYEYILILAKRIRKSWLGILPPDARRVCVTDPDTGQEEIIDPRQDLLDVLRALANGEGGVVPSGTDVKSFEVEVNAAGNYFVEIFKLINREILRAIYSRMLANNNDAAASTTGEFDRDMTSKVVNAVRKWFHASLYNLSYSLCYFTFNWVDYEDVPHIVVGRGSGMPTTISEVATLHQSGWFTRRQKAILDEQLGLPPDDGGELIGVNSNANTEQEAREDDEQERTDNR